MKKPFFENHFFLKVAHQMQEICKPLERFGIYHFTYLKNYHDGYQVNLSNCSNWVEDYYLHELYKTSSFEKHPQEYISGSVIWPSASTQTFYQHARKHFDNDHGITIIRKVEQGCEFYFFSGKTTNSALVNFFINNVDILNRFIIYFKDKAASLLKSAEKNKIFIQHHYTNIELSDDLFITHSMQYCNIASLRQEFFNETIPSKYTTKDNITITRREIDCIDGLLKRMTMNEIAESLNLSKRTVETYVRRLKLKFNCKSLKNLISILSQERFLF